MSGVELLSSWVSAVAPYRLFVMVATAISSLLVGVGVLWIRQTVLPRERWLAFFGLGFLAFSMQYLFAVGFGWVGGPTKGAILLVDSFILLGNAASSLFFLAMGRELLRRNRAVPLWALLFVVVVTMVEQGNLLGMWTRLPGAVFSALAFGTAGYALFKNISRRRQALAALALMTCFLISCLYLSFALIPPITRGGLWPEFDEALVNRGSLTALSLPSTSKYMRIATTEVLDTFLIFLALPLKILLASAGFLLIIRTMLWLSPETGRFPTSGKGQDGHEVFLEVLASITRSLEADRAKLWIRLPGLRERKVVWWIWSQGGIASGGEGPHAGPLPNPGDEGVGDVFKTGQLIEAPRRKRSDTPRPENGSFLAVPLCRHGHTVGCLQVEWEAPFAFTATTFAQVSRIADLIAPAVEQRQYLAALDSWERRTRVLEPSSRPDDPRAVAEALAEIVHDVLSPTAVGLSLDVGFSPVWAIWRGSHCTSAIAADAPLDELLDRFHVIAGALEVTSAPLEAQGVSIGTLLVAWPLAGEDRPVVRPDPLSGSAFASLVAGSVLGAAQGGLWSILSRLHVQLSSSKVESPESWFSALQVAARDAALLWLVAVADNDFFGPAAEAKVVAQLVGSEPQPTQRASSIHRVALGRDEADGTSVLRILLSTTKGEIWLGVQRSGFGPELEKPWPWRIFLERFAEAADAALARIVAAGEAKHLRKEADQAKGLIATTADIGLLMHELRNLARSLQFAAESIEEERKLGLLQAPESIAASMSALLESARRLNRLTDALPTAGRADGRSAYPLIDLIDSLRTLLGPILQRNQIDLEASVAPGLFMEFPFHLAHIAMLSLLTNSIDSIGQNGTIRIEGEDGEGVVVCRVIDGGPGIRPEIAAQLFNLGVSTKQGARGNGLFLVRSLLQTHGGDVGLMDASPGHTVFTLRFPKAQKTKRESHG